MPFRNLIILTVAFFIASSCSYFSAPTPVEELLPKKADINLEYYADSAPPDSGSTSVLILGTSHLAQKEQKVDSPRIERVTSSLATYDPDLVAVEYLPADYPRGKGRDYRKDFNVKNYASQWNMSISEADSIIKAYRHTTDWPSDPCRLAKSYFLQYDHANALYYWNTNNCKAVEKFKEINEWAEYWREHESVRIGHPVAYAGEVRELTSFDYQGEDAKWFIGKYAKDQLYSGRLDALYTFWPMIPKVGSIRGTYAARYGHIDNYLKELYKKNSPEHTGLQYWVYEEKMQRIVWDGDSVGSRQVDNYWLRNKKMFTNVQDAIKEKDAKRALIIVGAGHKYFLDELVRKSDYRWIDPREYLSPL
ncbi:DUF5694 domain-containing protein [Fodinibius sp. AD559]|uniref:DUF5694 domain-containing protein n=1 Tax=Fodinibius sp. AD559 TaxID=3424179 RepID=UPI004046E5F1